MTWKTRPRSEFGELAAIEEGTGPSLLLLHGAGLRAEAWNAQIDAFSASYAVVAPDMPGHGESLMPETSLSLSGYTDRVAAAVDQAALVVGHSMGAMMALDLAIRHPGKVRGVVALNAIYRRSPAAAQAVRERAQSLDVDRRADPAPTLRRWFGDAESPERLACQGWLQAVDPFGYKEAYTVFAGEDGPADDGLAGIGCRSLFMTGAEEPNSTPSMSEEMASKAGGEAHVLPGAAHMMPMTHAAEVNRALSRFFEGCDDG